MRRIDTIFVHCSATRPDWMARSTAEAKRDEIDRWHKERGFKSPSGIHIGYHYVIDRDGVIVEGRPVSEVGAHAKGHNVGSIGICLVGGHGSNENDKFIDHYTPNQAVALHNLIDRLKREYPTITKVRGHNEVAAKACPGFNVARWMAAKPERTVAQSTTMQAGAVQIVSGVGSGIGALAMLDGYAQLAAIGFVAVVVVSAMWIMRERLRQWARGVR